MSYICSACGCKSSSPARVCLCCGGIRVFMVPYVRGTVTMHSLLRYCRRKYERSLRRVERQRLRVGAGYIRDLS